MIRATGSVEMPWLIAAVWVSALDHESRDDAVKDRAVVIGTLGKRLEIFDVVRGDLGEKLEDDSTVIGFKYSDFVASVWSNRPRGGRVRKLFGHALGCTPNPP